jgi:phospholipid/cholesterol/gamma-HCH transport system substrate-binding protein
MEQQAKLVTTLESMKAVATKPTVPTLTANSSTTTATTVDDQPQLKSVASSQEKLLQQLREYAEKETRD